MIESNITDEKRLVSIVVDYALEYMQKHASSKGVKATKQDLLFAITSDPKGNTAKRFAELVSMGLEAVF
jgi:hypothetical protein